MTRTVGRRRGSLSPDYVVEEAVLEAVETGYQRCRDTVSP